MDMRKQRSRSTLMYVVCTTKILMFTTSTSAIYPSSISSNAGIVRTIAVNNVYWENNQGGLWSGIVSFLIASLKIVIVGIEFGREGVQDLVWLVMRILI